MATPIAAAAVAPTSIFELFGTDSRSPIQMAQSIIQSYMPSYITGCKLEARISGMTAVQVQELLTLVNDLLISSPNPLVAFERISQYLPLDKISSGLNPRGASIDAIRQAQASLSNAELFMKTKHPHIPVTMQRILSNIMYSLLSGLEGVISVFGIREFVQPSESPMESGVKAQKLFILLICFSALSTLLIPVAGPALGAAILGSILATIIVLSFVYPKIKPCPREIPRCTNWSELIQQGKLPDAVGRSRYCEQIANALRSGNRQPLLLGLAGAGKTTTAMAFAHELARGKYPELAGKQVFYLNAGTLLGSSITGSANILKTLLEQMGHHTKNIILVIDEVHTIAGNALMQQLKTYMERDKSESFKYVIGITTKSEYDRDLAPDAAFCRRWQNITLDSPTDEENLAILTHTLLQQPEHVLVQKGALKHILDYSNAQVEETPDGEPPIIGKVAQPLLAMQILEKCIRKTSSAQMSVIQTQLDQLRTHLAALQSASLTSSSLWGIESTPAEPAAEAGVGVGADAEHAAGAVSEEAGAPSLPDTIPGTLDVIAAKESELTTNQALRERIQVLRQCLALAKIKQCEATIALGKPGSHPSAAAQAHYLALSAGLIPTIERQLETLGGQAAFQVMITKDMVEEATRETIQEIRDKLKRNPSLRAGDPEHRSADPAEADAASAVVAASAGATHAGLQAGGGSMPLGAATA